MDSKSAVILFLLATIAYTNAYPNFQRLQRYYSTAELALNRIINSVAEFEVSDEC